jgi:phosphoribosylglycinamide formyltransferase 1
MSLKKIAIFGSGAGSNAKTICNYFASSTDVKVVFICTNNKNGLIVRRAGELNMPLVYTTKEGLANFSHLQKTLKDYAVDYIILAGFLLKLPFEMVNSYPKKIINIHPSLLPKYGGRGMYGNNVHRAVLENKEFESGITIHFINQNYDEGEIILQKKCPISEVETVESLEKKIRALEFEYFPKTIEKIVLQ